MNWIKRYFRSRPLRTTKRVQPHGEGSPELKNSDAEAFLSYLTEEFGKEEKILKHDCPHGGPPVYAFVYRNLPSPGMITAITFGLSWFPHPEWKFGRPELVVSVESTDESWALAAAYFAAEFRSVKRFCYGDVFTTDAPLASDTEMDGFVLFAPSVIAKEKQSLQLRDFKIHFTQLYPIYRSELPAYDQLGLEKFWHHPNFGLYDVKRPRIHI